MTHIVNPDEYAVDDHRSVDLSAYGSRGYWAVVAVDPHGEEILVMGTVGCTASDPFDVEPPPHELTGSLPPQVWRRVWSHPAPATFCGRPNRNGRPCRSTVGHPGEPCRWHVDAEPKAFESGRTGA